MTDSMNFGPDWIRNLSSEGSTGSAGGGMGTGGGTRYQLAEYRYGREEMLALFDKNAKPPPSLTNFKSLYSETTLLPLALLSTTEEERGWQGRMTSLSGPPVRGRGGSLERGGRPGRGRGGYQYIRTAPPYEGGGGWGNNGEQTEWSPRKEYNQRTMSMDNWRRSRNIEEDDGWRNLGQGRPGVQDKWGRSTSWRGEGDAEERTGPPERGGRASWNEHMNRTGGVRRSWDNEDHLPEWAMENPGEGGGSFDDKGAFHNSDDELLDGKPPNRREAGLQKSTSQQHISNKNQHPPLSASKSTMSLVKTDELDKKKQGPSRATSEECSPAKDSSPTMERKKSIPNIPEKIDKDVVFQESAKSEGPPKQKEPEKQPVVPNGPLQENFRNEDSDFDKLQEDFVTKLVVDEDPPKPSNNFDMSSMPVPPNLVPQQIQEKWFYQDPQGQMQGPFTNIEMAEWYKAGYFSHQLKVRRHCDERFFLLGELITMSGGNNPFQTGMRFPVLKNDITKMPETDLLQFQYLSQLNAYKQAQARISADPWNALMLQQQENSTQRLIMQQQVPQDLAYIQQQPAANPLMQMINQMQQANKLPGQGLVDKPTMSGAIDQHIQLQYLSMQNRMPPPTSMTNNLPTGLPTNISGGLQPENLPSSIPNLQSALINPGGIAMPGMPNNIPVSIGESINMSRPTTHSSVDQLNSNQEDPISSLLKQLQQKQLSEWSQNQFGMVTVPAPTQQWQTQSDVPLAMWDLQQNNVAPVPSSKIQSEPEEVKQQKIEKERAKDDTAVKEQKKKKELEDKQLKKEAEEKRKQEQRKQELEKKAAEEKKKKEEERVKKELEKAKKEAEEKRLRELEEKRRLKDQRKAEEEAKKRADEHRKAEEDRIRHELKEVEAKRQADEKRIQQEQIRVAKAAPWSQSNSTLGMSLAEIQKAEKERRAQETALQVQRLQEKELQQQQQHQQQEKTAGLQFNWAKKPVEPRKVKSLAEIQAEEQEQLAKQAAESRLHKEKEVVLPVTNNSSSIWNSQNLNWTNPSPSNHQWSSTGGFWDEMSSKNVVHKPSTVTKSNSTNSFNTSSAKQQQQPQQHQTKSKTKKDEAAKINNNNNNNGPSTDEFTNWCYKTLSNISTSVDIPTFVTFLRDIECAFDVREYCKEYLGESNATHQFANNFLEKRRSFKPKNNAHKDDMCSPAPAITPSLQHSTEFQEVKGKNKKNKKSKMLKVDSRILGFNVTSAPDRINVGDRDYGDNS